MEKKDAKFKIFRFDPDKDDKPYFENFTVPCKKGETVLGALFEIQDRIDGSLQFRFSCRAGVCGSCGMHINGAYRLACETQVSAMSQPIKLQPMSNMPVIKDLVVDMTEFWKKYRLIEPFLKPGRIDTDKELPQTADEREKLGNSINCILCGACSSSCTMTMTNEAYLGPAALLKAWRFVADSRDRSYVERLESVDGLDGVWRCHTIFNCQLACPKDLDPTGAIASLKREIIKKKVFGKREM